MSNTNANTDRSPYESAPRESASGASALAGHEIMIVDDDQRTAGALAAILAEAGFRTTVLHTGLEALRHAKSAPVSAAIIDVHLPDLNGLILSKNLREKLGAAVPIFVVSGDTSMETINSLSLVGATHFFAKPMSPAYLVEQLKEAFRKAEG